MKNLNKPFFDLTAADLMTQHIVAIPIEMSLYEAARVLRDAQVRGAPVVDHAGRTVGVLSTSDLARWAVDQSAPASEARLQTCQYQEKRREAGGTSVVLCLQPDGSCPMQSPYRNVDGTVSSECAEPNTMLADWQCVRTESLPAESVRHYMTTGAVTADAGTAAVELAKKMGRFCIKRVIIVDEQERPVGVVSSSDLIAAIARNDLASVV